MAVKATNLSKTLNYNVESDPDKGTDAATTFVLGALDARAISTIKDKATAIPVASLGTGEGFATIRVNEMNFDIVVHGLKNLINYDVPYKTVTRQLGGKNYTVIDPAIVESFPEDIIAELADKILTINTLTDEERKNSEG